nr:metalloprotease family protein [Bacillus cereus]
MGDISLTCSGIFFWLNTNAILSKAKFWIFMSLSIIVLSVIPAIISSFVSGNIKSILLFVCWINAIISASDIYI